MAIDETVFEFFFRHYRRLIDTSQVDLNKNIVRLDDCQGRLRLLASALMGRAVEIRKTDDIGGFIGDVLYLPSQLNLFDDRALNQQAYIFRTVFSVFLRQNTAPATFQEDTGTEIYRTKILEQLPALFMSLSDQHPGFEALKAAVAPSLMDENLFYLIGDYPKRGDPNLTNGDPSDPRLATKASRTPETEKSSSKATAVQKVNLSEEEENPLVHVFEKVTTAEEFQGGNRKMDDADELAEHGDALDELNLRHVIRTNQTSNSFYKTDSIVDAAPLAGTDNPGAQDHQIYKYREWSAASQGYNENWCTVYEFHPVTPPASSKLPVDPRKLHELRLRLEHLMNRAVYKKRQRDGSDLDIDAVVDRQTQIGAGGNVSDAVFIDRRFFGRDVSTYILMDASLSSDSWVADKRILDIMKQSLTILGQSLDGLYENIGVGAFFSNTRHRCDFLRLKDFTDDWDLAFNRINALEPQGYTRMGPAIRHATKILSDSHTKRKFLLLISDARPTDYDAYEGIHGEQDIRRSILEAETDGIRVHCLAITDKKTNHLQQMFGPNQFQYLRDPEALYKNIFDLYARILKLAH